MQEVGKHRISSGTLFFRPLPPSPGSTLSITGENTARTNNFALSVALDALGDSLFLFSTIFSSLMLNVIFLLALNAFIVGHKSKNGSGSANIDI